MPRSYPTRRSSERVLRQMRVDRRGIGREIEDPAEAGDDGGKCGEDGETDGGAQGVALAGLDGDCAACPADLDAAAIRSEEHTSELQSLMRISYAVFCLKKKTYNNQTNTKHV